MGRGRPHKCPYCAATKSVAKGFRYNKDGKVRLRRCKICGRRWTAATAIGEQSSSICAPEDNSGLSSDALSGYGARQASNRAIELSLSAEGSPSQEDSGGEGKEESEETLFTP